MFVPVHQRTAREAIVRLSGLAFKVGAGTQEGAAGYIFLQKPTFADK
jgi:hypothetical protein